MCTLVHRASVMGEELLAQRYSITTNNIRKWYWQVPPFRLGVSLFLGYGHKTEKINCIACYHALFVWNDRCLFGCFLIRAAGRIASISHFLNNTTRAPSKCRIQHGVHGFVPFEYFSQPDHYLLSCDLARWSNAWSR